MASSDGESVMDVLARMKTELSFDVDELVQTGEVTTKSDAVAPVPAAQVAPSAPVLKSVAAVPPVVAGTVPVAFVQTDPVDDLSSYMGDLLNRYGKGGAAHAAAAAAATDTTDAFHKSALPQRKPRAAEPVLELAATVSAELGELEGSGPTGEGADHFRSKQSLLEQQGFKPRKRAPEEKACIDAMRELAVHSARRAIQTFDNKRRGLDAKYRLGLAFVAFAASGVAFMFAEEMFSLLGLVAMCGLATGSMFVVNWQQTVALLKRSTGN